MEKRDAKRYIKKVPMRFGTQICDHIGVTHNISESGVLLKSNRIFPPSTKLTLEFSLSSKTTVSCQGIVQWAKRVPPAFTRLIQNHGMGITLIHPDMEYRHFIYELSGHQERRKDTREDIGTASGLSAYMHLSG